MRKIAVCVSFVHNRFDSIITTAANQLGFDVDYYTDKKELAPNIDKYEILYGDVGPDIIRNAANLRWVCSPNAGIEKYLPSDAMPQGCILSNFSGSYGPAIAEHIIMVLLMLMRHMPEYQTSMADHSWPCFNPIRSINGSRILLLGTGDIGSNTARRLKALGAHITGICRSGKSDEPAFDKVVKVSEMDSLLGNADALIMCLPATADTIGILNRDRIARLGKQCYVINVGRGSAIDQEALIDALNSHAIAGAALDVMLPEPLPADNPLWNCPNTIITPHVSGNTALDSTCRINVDMFLSDLQRYAAGKDLKYFVDRNIGY